MTNIFKGLEHFQSDDLDFITEKVRTRIMTYIRQNPKSNSIEDLYETTKFLLDHIVENNKDTISMYNLDISETDHEKKVNMFHLYVWLYPKKGNPLNIKMFVLRGEKFKIDPKLFQKEEIQYR
jgi:hypothetical protein